MRARRPSQRERNEHDNRLREIHGRRAKPLCPSCGYELRQHPACAELVAFVECTSERCTWSDFDERQDERHVRGFAYLSDHDGLDNL